MGLLDSMLFEFDHEMAVTRQVLERVPEAAFAWRPHQKSRDLGGLAAHLAQIPHWGTTILERDGYDLTESLGRRAPEHATRAEVMDLFDRHVAEVRKGLLSHSDAELLAPWTLKRGGDTIMVLPRLAAIRSFMLHHLIHHRGQMTVYLRMQDVAIPPMYGQTADEPA